MVGGAADGPEWGQQPNTNMFSYNGELDPKEPANTLDGVFFKSLGRDQRGRLRLRDIAFLDRQHQGPQGIPEAVGIKMGYENLSVPFGASDFTADALAMKQAGWTAPLARACSPPTSPWRWAPSRRASHSRAALMFSGTDSSLFSNPTAAAAAQGTYWPADIVPIDLNNPATETFVANLQKYDSDYKGGYPSYGVITAYLGADAMIEGLTVAGQNPTRQSFITNMQKVSSWDADGLLASPVGLEPLRNQTRYDLCEYFTKVQGNQFVTINNGKPFCGTLIPNSDVAS